MRTPALPQPGLAWRPTFWLCLVGLVLPNALTLGALAAGIGTPPRTAAILAFACLALVARLVPFGVTAALFVALVVYDAVATLALLFGLAPGEILTALQLSTELKLFESPLYRGLIAGALLMVALNLVALARWRGRMSGGNALALVAAAGIVAGLDFVSNTSAHYAFGSLYGTGRPVESAADASGFRAAALTGGRNAVLVIVEALGHFEDPALQALLLSPFRDPALAARYAVTTGETTYYGSTTAGEMRELCDTRVSYDELTPVTASGCLPVRLAARGYDTVGVHNFTRSFFGRDAWWPQIGLRSTVFGEDLTPRTGRRCGGPFKAVCDTDVVPLLHDRLQAATKPTFLYWLTLSTHVPIALREGTARFGCQDSGGRFGHVEVCNMAELWADVFASLTAMTADLPGTDILIVGDHAPPLWSKTGRGLFAPGKVTWIRLTPKPGGHAVAAIELRGSQD
jgi:hypothetical protein